MAFNILILVLICSPERKKKKLLVFMRCHKTAINHWWVLERKNQDKRGIASDVVSVSVFRKGNDRGDQFYVDCERILFLSSQTSSSPQNWQIRGSDDASVILHTGFFLPLTLNRLPLLHLSISTTCCLLLFLMLLLQGSSISLSLSPSFMTFWMF